MLGRIIRGKRIEMGMSLRHLAHKTELTPSFLSQVERDRSEPSVSSLRKIAEALGVPPYYFFLHTEGTDPVIRSDECTNIVFPLSSATCQILTPGVHRRMAVMKFQLAPGAVSSPEPVSHPGEECTHVLMGMMSFFLGDKEYKMGPGDSIYYFSSIPHRIVNTGTGELVVISAVTPPNF